MITIQIMGTFSHRELILRNLIKEKNSTLRMGFGSGYRIVNVFTEDHAALTGARDVFFQKTYPQKSHGI